MADLLGAWRGLDLEQRAAAVGALLLVVSTFGPFSFVEAAVVLTGGAVLALLYLRGTERRFDLPLADGTLILAAGGWAAFLVVVRLFDRPLGQNLLALACAGILALAGVAERAKRPPEHSLATPDEAPSRAPEDAPTRALDPR